MSGEQDEQKGMRTLQLVIAAIVIVIGLAAFLTAQNKRSNDADEYVDNIMRQSATR